MSVVLVVETLAAVSVNLNAADAYESLMKTHTCRAHTRARHKDISLYSLESFLIHGVLD